MLLVLQHRDRLFGSQLAVRLGDSGNRARQALLAFAQQAGFVEPQAAIEWQVDRARRVLAEDTDTPPEVIRTNFARRVRGSFPYHHESGGFRQDFEALKSACPEPADPETFNEATRDLLDQVLLASCRPLERDTDNGRPPDVPRRNVLALASIAMESMFSWESGEDGRSGPTLSAAPVTELLAALIDSEEVLELRRRVKALQQIATGEHRGHYNGIHGFAAPCFSDFAEAGPAGTLFFGCEPFCLTVESGSPWAVAPLDFADDVDAEHRRRVYVLHPDLGHGADTLVARALKACFFEAVLNSEKRRSAGGTMPLVAYVADEFHRFVTSDRAHGDQSYADTCRSYGGYCVFACQSISSLRHGLAHGSGNRTSDVAAVSMLVANTANKLFFRSTDPEVRAFVEELWPQNPGDPSAVAVRPLSTLRAGECYAVTADGRFERCQLDPCPVLAAPPTEAEREQLAREREADRFPAIFNVKDPDPTP